MVVLFLIEDSIKYFLYIFAIFLTGILLVLFFKTDYKFKIKIPFLKKIIDYFFIFSTLFVFIYNLDNNPVTDLVFYFSLIISFFLPGWVLLRVLGMDEIGKKPVAVLVLSFTCSLSLTPLVFYVTNILETNIFNLLSTIFLLVSLIPLLKDGIPKLNNNLRSVIHFNSENIRIFDIIILSWIVLFFVFVISNLYPQMVDNPFSDISRLYSQAEELILVKEQIQTPYPWYYFNLATIYELSSVSNWLFQYSSAYLSIMLIFAFYIMSKTFLSDINNRSYLLATIFFFVFAGFGWFFFVEQSLTISDEENHFDILSIASSASYWDILYGQGPWLWFWLRPITFGFTIFFSLLYLMKQENLRNRNYMIVSSILLLGLTQIHLPEFVIFTAFIFSLSIFLPKLKLRLQQTSISAIIALTISTLLIISYQNLINPGFTRISILILVGLIFLFGLAFFFSRFQKRPKIKFKINTVLVTLIILSIYFGLFFYWFSIAENISLDEITTILAVPWEFYPVLLGIIGAVSIPGIILVLTKYRNHPVAIFLVLSILAIILGRIITFLNAEFTNTGYWERRLIPFVFVGVSILAGLFISNIFNNFSKAKRYSFLKKMIVVVFLASFVLVGISSTFLSVEYFLLILPKNIITDQERYLQGILKEVDPNSMVLTITDRSRAIINNMPFNLIPNSYRSQIWPAESPELTLEALSFFGKPTFFYFNTYDFDNIRKYEEGHIASHILKNAPVIYEGPEGKIMKLEINSHPTSKSDMVLANIGNVGNYYYAYDILSLGGYNYTTVLLSDINSFGKARIVVVPNEYSANKLIEYKNKYELPFEKLFVLNLDGYGSLVNVNYTSSYSKKILDENKLSEWITSGIGSGNIGIPHLGNNYVYEKNTLEKEKNDRITSNNYLIIDVGKGNYAYWEITKNFNEHVDFSEYENFKLNWYGKGDGGRYVIQFHTNPGEYFWYTFDDTWTGWKQVILPLHKSDGPENVYGTIVNKVTKDGATWEKIKSIDIRTEASNKNNSGIFYIDDLAFDKKIEISNIQSFNEQNEIKFTKNLDMNTFLIENDYTTLANYEGDIPFILYKTYDDFEMFYFNVKPIIDKFSSSEDVIDDFYILGEIIDLIDHDLPAFEKLDRKNHSLTAPELAAFKKANFNGETSVVTSSAILLLNKSSISVNIDGNNLVFENVTKILPVNIDKLTVTSQAMEIDGGSGFYTFIKTNSSTANFSGDSASLLIELQNNEESMITGKDIQIILTESEMMIRQPTIMTNGTTIFDDFFAYRDLNKKIGVLNEDIQFQGKVSFQTKFSDEFNIVLNPNFEGKIIRSEQKYAYDELIDLRKIFDFLFR